MIKPLVQVSTTACPSPAPITFYASGHRVWSPPCGGVLAELLLPRNQARGSRISSSDLDVGANGRQDAPLLRLQTS